MSFNITGDNPLYIDASDMEGKLKTMQRIMRKEQYEKLLYGCNRHCSAGRSGVRAV